VITGIDLDHVAVAVERWPDAWPRFVDVLGGRWKSGGRGPGFAPSQLGYANGMRVEVLEPHQVDDNDFLRRFLDRSGPGPHHLTFKLNDIAAALVECEAAGYAPVNVDLSDAGWKEAFLHPKQATGVVVQLAQADEGGWSTPAPEGFPLADRAPAALVRVAHAVADLDEGVRLFGGLLGGVEAGAGADGSVRWVELAWPGPGRVRLLSPTSPDSPLWAWLEDRPGRVHHLAFTGAGRTGELPPDEPTGTRIVLED
jgi:glyoxalase/bleomycin resistance protein/dioxygenase superfamily protein